MESSTPRSRILHGFSWSAAFLLVTRASTLIAVPIVLHDLGADLYAVWVLAGSLVTIQSLFDLGVASALVRYVAVAAAADARSAVVIVARRAMIFYLFLSVIVVVPVWFGAGAMVDLVHFLKPNEHGEAVAITRWAVVAFALTNVTLVIASVLQGIDRVGVAYRDQTLSWLLYVPLLVIGMSVVSHAQAVGLAWVVIYTLQILLLSRSLARGIRGVPKGVTEVPRFSQMLSFGGRWQVSAWADFVTFQLPRFIAGLTLSSGDLVSLDVAIRAGQFVVAPLFAFYPTVLPRAASLLGRDGGVALRRFLQRFYSIGVPAVIVGVSVFVPLEVPAVATWTGRSVSTFNPLVGAAILIGTAAHASTGLLTSALMARGDINPVVLYKGRQLLLAVILLAVAAPIGVVAVAIALGVSLALPAVTFNMHAARAFGLDSPLQPMRKHWRLIAYALAQIAIPTAIVVYVGSAVEAWQLLILTILAAMVCLALGVLLLGYRLVTWRYWLRVVAFRPRGSSAAAVDHLAKK
jgi:O-antigen/teichoic acid export membrane protein